MTDETIFCSELISIRWNAPYGRLKEQEGLLEEMAGGMAMIWSEGPVPPGKRLSVKFLGGEFNGSVLESVAEGDGFLTKLVIFEKTSPRKLSHALVINTPMAGGAVRSRRAS